MLRAAIKACKGAAGTGAPACAGRMLPAWGSCRTDGSTTGGTRYCANSRVEPGHRAKRRAAAGADQAAGYGAMPRAIAAANKADGKQGDTHPFR